MLHVLCVLRMRAGVVEAFRSARWRAWCLSMDGEGRQRRATRVDDGGYVEGCGFRIWSEFPLAEIADILSRKEVTRLVLRA